MRKGSIKIKRDIEGTVASRPYFILNSLLSFISFLNAPNANGVFCSRRLLHLESGF